MSISNSLRSLFRKIKSSASSKIVKREVAVMPIRAIEALENTPQILKKRLVDEFIEL